MIHIVTCPDRHLPDKVLESITELQSNGLDETTHHTDGGLSAVFFAIPQGKQLLKRARDVATDGKKDMVHLEDLTKSMAEIESFAETISTASVDLVKGFTICKDACDALDKAATKSNELSKGMISDSKKRLVEFISSICKAFFVGPMKSWYVMSAESFSSSRTFSNVPCDGVQHVKVLIKFIMKSKHVPKDVTTLCNTLVASQDIMLQLSRSISECGDDALKSTGLARALDGFDSTAKTYESTLKPFGLFDDQLQASISKLRHSLGEVVATRIGSDLDDILKQLGNIMAKAVSLQFTVCR